MPDSSVLERLSSALQGATSFGPVPDGRIAAAERELGLTFPDSYRAFLRLFGASFGHGYELAGLADIGDAVQPPMWNDVVITTLRHRRVSQGAIPSTLIFVSSDGCSDTFYLDTNHDDTVSESPVVVLGPGRDYEVVAPSFVAFVEQLTCNAPSA